MVEEKREKRKEKRKRVMTKIYDDQDGVAWPEVETRSVPWRNVTVFREENNTGIKFFSSTCYASDKSPH